MIDSKLQQKRLMAAAIDMGVWLAIVVAFWMIDAAIAASSGTVIGDPVLAGGAGYAARLVGLCGALLGLGYVLLRDVIVSGRSLGKKLQGLRVLTGAGGGVDVVLSARRNALFALGPALNVLSAILGLMPCLGTAVSCFVWPLMILGVVATVAIVAIEVVRIVQEPEGLRLGDKLADTHVLAD